MKNAKKTMNPLCATEMSGLRQRPGTARAGRGGFTLIELMVALSLAALMTLGIMSISNTSREVFQGTTKKVELANRLRLASLTLERELSQWIDTPNLEFFVDGVGAGARRNGNWDEGEELPDTSDERGPGVVDGGEFGKYDEYATITERYYYGIAPGEDPNLKESRKQHAAFQAYFRTITYIDGELRDAIVEYRLVDPTKLDRYGNPQMPTLVVGEDLASLSLVKIVRYHDIDHSDLEQLNRDFPIKRRWVEVASNVTDFKVEYTVENRFAQRARSRQGPRLVTPREEFEGPAEKGVAPTRISDPSGVVYRKRFGYGSNRIDLVGNYEKAKGFKARQGDRTPLGNHTPVRFGWTSSTEINFAELVRGSKIFIFTEANRGGGPAGQAAKLATRPIRFPTNIYTVQSNVSGQLEFYEGIDSSSWEGDQGPLYYKASFVPSAVRITLRVVDDDARNPRTVQRLIWVRAKTR